MPADDELDQLLQEIRTADRAMRIEHRDRVVAHGSDAIEPMLDWLDDPEFAAFAVRALEWIGREGRHRKSVVDGLVGALTTATTPAIQRDIEEALAHLGRRSVGVSDLTRRHPAQRLACW